MDCEAQTRAGTPCSRPALRDSAPPRCLAHSPEEVKAALGFGAVAGHLGGRPRKPRVGEILAEQAREHAEEIVSAFRRALADSDPRVATAAAEKWLRAAQRSDELAARERDRQPTHSLEQLLVANFSRDELIRLLAPMLAERSSRGLLPSPDDFADAGGMERLMAELERPPVLDGTALPVVDGTAS